MDAFEKGRRALGGEVSSETNLVAFKLRRTGASLMLTAEPVRDGLQTFTMQGLQVQRFRFEHDILRALQNAGIGSWSEFPQDSIQATVTRDQLLTMGFKGIY